MFWSSNKEILNIVCNYVALKCATVTVSVNREEFYSFYT